ncbi:restriction endonuclease subunit S [Weissella confusa]|uniref:restriction endonuclease subunit S n=1 Tax=Weissella confusa TaxID=1583 RepID=UPI0018F25401|nr:restriction endonuclease subunit S [Weissella confusa]MBJ7668443.1 restriction endonuclease subunit S [Weissella confusa]
MSNKVPQIRFNGYSDAWEKRNLADLSDGFSYGLNAAAKEYDGVHGYLRITDIDEVSHSFLPEGLTSPNIPEDQLTDYRMDEQSIVYARTGASTGKTYIYRDSDGELYYAGFLIRQKVNKETSAQFVYQNTLTKAWERYVQVMSQRSGQPGINAQEVGRFELAIPERTEQDKIAHLFNSLDNLIAANQHKLDLLKEQKKGYLQKMFPKNGAKVPELRFAGFADDWEERKLGDEVLIVMGQSPNSENYTDNPNDHILVQGNADMKNGHVFPRVWTTQVTKQAEKNDLILSVRAPVGDIGKTDYDVVIGRGVAAIKGNEFIFQNLGKMKSDGYWTRYSTGSTFESINSSDIKEAMISIPRIEEQKKIGSFFKQLDDTIALHQRKLELLKEQKKGFLQKMFV